MMRNHIFDFLIFLIFSFSCISGNDSIPEYPKIKMCDGAADPEGINFIDPSASYRFVKKSYSNCTHIIGSVVLNNLVGDVDLSFLNSIVEIGGSLVIINMKNVSLVSFQNLTIIRGHVPYKYQASKYDSKKASLIISYNKIMNGKRGIINLGSLTSVLQHGIRIVANTGYCHLNLVDWSLFPEEKSQNVQLTFFPCPSAASCSPSCVSVKGKQYCYGDKPNMCQSIPRCSREICGSARCYKDGAGIDRCCNDECSGGCHDSKRTGCFACKNFLMDSECRVTCPPRIVYDKESRTNIKNPAFRPTLGSLCVKKCPQHYLEDGSSCVRQCTTGKTFYSVKEKKCVPCRPGLPECQVCQQRKLEKQLMDKKGEKIEKSTIYDNSKKRFLFTPRSVMQALINCSIYDGDIEVNLLSHSPKDDLEEHIRAEDFENLKNLEHLNGQLYLMVVKYPSVKSLYFLSKLKSVTYSGKVGFFVLGNPNLEYLGLSRLKEIKVKHAQVINAANLCYMENFKQRFGSATVTVKGEKQYDLCKKEGKVCDKKCSPKGCWGPGRFMCFECLEQTAGDECVSKCENAAGGYYTIPGNSTCGKCHPQCKTTCSGPKADQCIGGCKFAQNGTNCVANCSLNQYLDKKHFCQPCASVCTPSKLVEKNPVCGGPKARRSPEGCMRCEIIQMDRSGKQTRCVSKCPKKDYYEIRLSPQDVKKNADELQKSDLNNPTMACHPCHRYCEECTNQFSFSCDECKAAYYYTDPRTCSVKCEGNTYKNDTGKRRCLPCDKRCRNGCSGPYANDCYSCEKYRNYFDTTTATKTKNWTCVFSCPSDKNLTYPDSETGDTICVSVLPGSSRRLTVGLSVGLFVFVVLIVAIIILVCVQRRRAKILRDRDVMRARYTRQITNEMPAINTTDYEPNAGQLRMIGNKYLTKGIEIGAGAFGTVYKGIWRPPKEKDSDVEISIDVAIKELKESGNLTTTKEFLDEAHVMASVEHHFCIQLLGVCLSSHMQLVTEFMPLGCLKDYLPKHEKELGSQQLLTWTVQIAKGMAYLESRGIVHRDLAARNVLLQSKEQTRITDFGLAKLLDPSGDEFQADSGRFPIRWLALECLDDRIFSSKSDVWSFGVTCWEIFTFGHLRPYQDVAAANLYDFLDAGERLQQPEICTLDIYMLMIKCWLGDPESRPLFSELVQELSSMASDPGRYLIIKHDSMRHRMADRDSSCETSTSPRVSSVLSSDSDKPLKPPTVVVMPDANLPHLAAEIAGRAAAPSVAEHYSEDPIQMSQVPALPPPPVPLARLDEEVDVETGNFDVEDDYLLPDANDDDYVAPSPRSSVRPPSKVPPDHEYMNQLDLRDRAVHNPQYQSEIEPIMDDDYLAPDSMNNTRGSNYSDMDAGEGYLDPLITKHGSRPVQSNPRV